MPPLHAAAVAAEALALHTYNAVAQLPLPLSDRAALLADLYRATAPPPPLPPARLQVGIQAGPLTDFSALSALSPAEQAQLRAALSAPTVAATLAAALARQTGPPTPPSPQPHPLGPEARFPPRIARLLGLESHALSGAPRPLPGFPFSGHILGYPEALRLDPAPRSAIIIGAGYIGAELALGWASTGRCAVTLLDRQPGLMRGYLPALVTHIHALLVEAGVEVSLGVQVTGWHADDPHTCTVHGQRTAAPEDRLRWSAERIVVAVGLA